MQKTEKLLSLVKNEEIKQLEKIINNISFANDEKNEGSTQEQKYKQQELKKPWK